MSKIKLGDTYSEEIVFKQDNVIKFAECTGDNNPIHLDEEYAAKTPFGKPIVHGFLAGSVFSKVFGTEWPGEGTIYMNQSMSFFAPVFAGETYTAKFEVIETNEEKHRGVVKTTLEDASGKIVIDGTAMLMHRDKL